MTSPRRLCGRISLALALGILPGACSVSTTSGPPLSAVNFRSASTGLPVQGIWKSTPALVDLNGDGLPDLAALPRLGDGPRVWLGTTGAQWTEASQGLKGSGSCGGGVTVADVNRDGHPDLVVADHCNGVFVYLGDGQGHWNAVVKELQPAIAPNPVPEDEDDPFLGAEDVAVGDVNEDGFLDLVVTASNQGGFSVYLGDGSGKVWKEITEPDGLPSGTDAEPDDTERAGWANRVLLADVDGDKHLDVVASYHSGPRVWRGNGAARWQPFSVGLPSPEAGGVYRALALGDVDGDGRVDLVTTHFTGGVEVYVQTAEGAWRRVSSPALSSLAGGATAVALGDLDGDGHLDLVVGGRRKPSETAGVFVFLGNGKAEWREVRTGLPSAGYPFVWGITIGDLNRDGTPDVVVAAGFSAAPHPMMTARARAAGVPPPAADPSTAPKLQVWINSRPTPAR